MSRPRYRAQLESGPKLDINHLMRNMRIAPGSKWCTSMSWKSNYTGEEIATVRIIFNIFNEQWGSCQIRLGDRVQYLTREARPRHFWGRQWYFVCPITRRRSSVLWMPPGARSFACPQTWGRQVAYGSQFLDCTEWIPFVLQGRAEVRQRISK
jgi:hypothetical protein